MGSEADNEIPDTGAVFTFGASYFADNLPSHFFIRNDPIIHLACGDEHTIVMCQNGRLFGFGGNEYGQIGLGHKNPVVKPSCIKSLKPEKVKLITCGRYHSIASTESNHLYCWGSNNGGQLGTGEGEDGVARLIPTRCDEGVTFNGYIKQLAAGSSHSVLLTSEGKVYVWGSNIEGQLGLGDGIKKVKSPSLLPLKDFIVQIACGFYHTLLLSEKGQIFVFGEGDGGKLGLGGNNSVPLPIPLAMEDLLSSVSNISAGGNYSMAVTEGGVVYAWGENEQEQLGLPGNEYVQIFRPTVVSSLNGVNIKEIFCGQQHSAFISDMNELYICGDTLHGKLCSENEVKADVKIRSALPFKVSKFKGFTVEKVACGGKHTMVLALPDKPSKNTLQNGFSEHINTSLNNCHNNKSTSHTNSSLELPADHEIVSPPPSKTIESPMIISVPANGDEHNEQNSDQTSNRSNSTSPPLPANKSSPYPFPKSYHKHNKNGDCDDRNKSNELKNHLEIKNVISDDDISSSSKSDETVSIKHNFPGHDSDNEFNKNKVNCTNDYLNSRKKSLPKIIKLENNYCKTSPTTKILYKGKQKKNSPFCYSEDTLCFHCENKRIISDKYNLKDNEAHAIDDLNDSCDSDFNENDYDDNNAKNYCSNICDHCNENLKLNKSFVNNKNKRIKDDLSGGFPEDYIDDDSVEMPLCKNNHMCFKQYNSNRTYNCDEKFKELKPAFGCCSFNNYSTELLPGVIPKIICFYEQNELHSKCRENNKKNKGIQWFKERDIKKSEEQKQKRKSIEIWLKKNEQCARVKHIQEKRYKIRSNKSHSYDVYSKNQSKDSIKFFDERSGKRGGTDNQNGRRGKIFNNFQCPGRFFPLKEYYEKKTDKEADKIPIPGTTHLVNKNNQSSSPMQANSDSVLTRIFGNKKVTKNNHSGQKNTDVEQNRSNNDIRSDEESSEASKDVEASQDTRRNDYQPNAPPVNGNARGHQRNSKMCLIL